MRSPTDARLVVTRLLAPRVRFSREFTTAFTADATALLVTEASRRIVRIVRSFGVAIRVEYTARGNGVRTEVMPSLFRRANGLSLSRHVPSRARGATQRVAPDEPRKRRADERHVVGCCEELARPQFPFTSAIPIPDAVHEEAEKEKP